MQHLSTEFVSHKILKNSWGFFFNLFEVILEHIHKLFDTFTKCDVNSSPLEYGLVLVSYFND